MCVRLRMKRCRFSFVGVPSPHPGCTSRYLGKPGGVHPASFKPAIRPNAWSGEKASRCVPPGPRASPANRFKPGYTVCALESSRTFWSTAARCLRIITGKSVYETCAERWHSMIVPPSYSLMYPTHFSRSIITSFVKPCFAKYPTALLSANVIRCVMFSSSHTYFFRWFISRVP